MAKFLPKLLQTHVRITGYGGKAFNCPLLPVSAKAVMDECARNLEKAATPAEIEREKARLVELIRTVMPEPYSANLDRLPLELVTELVAYLMYGDGDDEPLPEGGPENPPVPAAAPAGSTTIS